MCIRGSSAVAFARVVGCRCCPHAAHARAHAAAPPPRSVRDSTADARPLPPTVLRRADRLHATRRPDRRPDRRQPPPTPRCHVLQGYAAFAWYHMRQVRGSRSVVQGCLTESEIYVSTRDVEENLVRRAGAVGAKVGPERGRGPARGQASRRAALAISHPRGERAESTFVDSSFSPPSVLSIHYHR